MKNLSLALLALASCAASAAAATNNQGYSDHVEFDRAGFPVTVRTSEAPDLKGGKMRIEQRLDAIDAESFVYDYHSQSAETKKYHREFCAERGMEPAMDGDSVLSNAVSGWVCRKDMTVPSGQEHEAGSTSSLESSKAVDYVVVRAPSGTVRVGDNFYAEGQARAQSSRAGALNTTVVVDNRCRHNRVEHHGGPFSTQFFIGVNCIIDQARSVPTRMEACIPDQCGQASGSVTAR
ncbi:MULTISPECIES: hypothetical protein [unclassified Stenotrophomonas]|jgi:hypothetical protein|uniref:hypothetical protein n=1 Tax=unclassified Stenotrophomonas TaxID=196198 RepID=UPI003715D5A8